jgi:hypothetical protein
VENQSDRWITEDGDSFYYDMNETSIKWLNYQTY